MYLGKRKSSMTNDVFRITIPAKCLPYVIRRPITQHLLHCNTVITEAKPIFIVHITMATGNHRNRDETSHTNQALKKPWKSLKWQLGCDSLTQPYYVLLTCPWYDGLLQYSRSTPRGFFMGPFFVLRTYQALMSRNVVLPCSYIMLLYTLHVQLFLQPRLVSRRVFTLPQL